MATRRSIIIPVAHVVFLSDRFKGCKSLQDSSLETKMTRFSFHMSLGVAGLGETGVKLKVEFSNDKGLAEGVCSKG